MAKSDGTAQDLDRNPRAADDADDADDVQGGDAACWANRVCQQCGRLNEAERPVVCEACGTRFE